VAGTGSKNREALLAAARNAQAGYLIVPDHRARGATGDGMVGRPARVTITCNCRCRKRNRASIGTARNRSAVMTLVRPNPEALAERSGGQLCREPLWRFRESLKTFVSSTR